MISFGEQGIDIGGRRAVERKSLKESSTALDGRQRRLQVSTTLRKSNREESIKKRRKMAAEEFQPGENGESDEKSPPSNDGGVDSLTEKGWVPEVKIFPGPTHLVDITKCQEISLRVKKTVENLPPNTRKTASQQALLELGDVALAVNSNDRKTQLAAVIKLRAMLSLRCLPPVQEAVDTGFVPRILYLIQDCDKDVARDPMARELQHEALWACTNVVSGTTFQARHCVEHNAVAVFVHCLKSPSEDVRCQAMWAVGNVAGECCALRDLLVDKTPTIELLLANCSKVTKIETLRNIAWTMSNLCRGKPQPSWLRVKMLLPPASQLLLQSQDTEVLVDACWTIAHLSNDHTKENYKIEAVLQTGVAPKLVELLNKGPPNSRMPALRALSQMVSGTDAHTRSIVSCNFLPVLYELLKHPKMSIRRETCWALSNIATGSADQIQQIIDARLIPPLILFVKSAGSVDFETRKEAMWTLSNAVTKASMAQIQYMVGHGLIAAFCAQLPSPDPQVVILALEGLQNVLEKQRSEKPAHLQTPSYTQQIEMADGLKFLESLQAHDNDEIYDKAAKILQTYFQEDEEDAEGAEGVEGDEGRDKKTTTHDLILLDRNKSDQPASSSAATTLPSFSFGFPTTTTTNTPFFKS